MDVILDCDIEAVTLKIVVFLNLLKDLKMNSGGIFLIFRDNHWRIKNREVKIGVPGIFARICI